MRNAHSLTNDQLADYRKQAVELRVLLNAEQPEDFTCDNCGMKHMCRYVYAPANAQGQCAAEVIQRAPREVTTDFGKKSDRARRLTSAVHERVHEVISKPTRRTGMEVEFIPFDEVIVLEGDSVAHED